MSRIDLNLRIIVHRNIYQKLNEKNVNTFSSHNRNPKKHTNAYSKYTNTDTKKPIYTKKHTHKTIHITMYQRWKFHHQSANTNTQVLHNNSTFTCFF